MLNSMTTRASPSVVTVRVGLVVVFLGQVMIDLNNLMQAFEQVAGLVIQIQVVVALCQLLRVQGDFKLAFACIPWDHFDFELVFQQVIVFCLRIAMIRQDLVKEGDILLVDLNLLLKLYLRDLTCNNYQEVCYHLPKDY